MKLTLIILLFLVTSIFSQSRNSNFEFSGIDQFWNIVKTLESNREPSKTEWNKLFDTPGYKVLLSSEFSRKFFEYNFRLVFKPNEKSNLESELKSGRNRAHLNHYIKVRDNKDRIKEQYKRLKRNKEHRTALKRTLEYLPQRRVSQNAPVSFVIFESNGRGSSPIVVDLAASIEWDFVSFLAHEYHHWYRNRQLQFSQNRVSREDIDLINAFSLIEAEGIADMVDKKDWYTKPNNAISSYARSYINDVKRTASIISFIDNALIHLSNNPSQIRKIGYDILNVLPQRGHTTGYYMARLILEKISKKELLRTVGNPFGFLKLYDRAAKKTGGKYPGFSKESIDVIDELANKYAL